MALWPWCLIEFLVFLLLALLNVYLGLLLCDFANVKLRLFGLGNFDSYHVQDLDGSEATFKVFFWYLGLSCTTKKLMIVYLRMVRYLFSLVLKSEEGQHDNWYLGLVVLLIFILRDTPMRFWCNIGYFHNFNLMSHLLLSYFSVFVCHLYVLRPKRIANLAVLTNVHATTREKTRELLDGL